MKSQTNPFNLCDLFWCCILLLMCISNCKCHNQIRHHRHNHRRRSPYADEDADNMFGFEQVTKQPEILSAESAPTSTVTVYNDDPAYLHCKVGNRGKFDVTWIRHRDRQLLTVGEDRFTDDHRFQLSLRKDATDPNVEDMTLILRYTRKNDSGIYECQVSTDPPLRFLVTLNVTEESKRLSKKSDLPSNDSPDSHKSNEGALINGDTLSAAHRSSQMSNLVAIFICLHRIIIDSFVLH